MNENRTSLEQRVEMLKAMYKRVEGNELLLLEKISTESNPKEKSPANPYPEKAFKLLIGTVLSVRTKDETTGANY